MTLVTDSQLALDPKRVPRCIRCGARAYWSDRAVCLDCTLKEEEGEEEVKQ